jgi:O-antigen/teichoic acid export membrane protein
LIDAGASSVATLVAGVAAARLLGSSELGAYALVFSALMLASQLPTQMSLTPSEARLVVVAAPERIGYLLTNLRVALPWAAVGALLTVLAGWLVPPDVGSDATWALALTGGLATLFMPLQEHARRLLHMSSMHWAAAGVSIVRLVAVIVALALGWASALRLEWLPLGALAVADSFSLVVALTRRGSPGVREVKYGVRDLAGSGVWLLVGAMVAPAAAFLISFLVTRLASSADLGVAEAARVAAQPALVLAVGLSAVSRPEAMEAAVRFDRGQADRLTRQFASIIGGVSSLYLLLTLVPHAFNPVYRLVPQAFEVAGLVQVSIVAAAVNGMVFLQRSELTALNRTKSLAVAEAWAAGLRTSVAFGAGWLAAWSVPLGFLLGGLTRMRLFRRLLDVGVDR